ncbi:MAG: F0F1 ATP synthase subunit B [Bacteroidia bacterium]|nr:F0F1 ATP synthase subunit B [Bacteroidia bacterium]
MIILNALITPSVGLIFWTTLVFLLLLFLLAKYAWKPILNAIENRERNIEASIQKAEEAKKSLEQLKSEGEKILAEARVESEKILKEAREIRDKIINDSKKQAQVEADKILANARAQIQSEKNAVLNDLKSQVAALSLEIAEKILKSELSDKEKQRNIVKNLCEQLNPN